MRAVSMFLMLILAACADTPVQQPPDYGPTPPGNPPTSYVDRVTSWWNKLDWGEKLARVFYVVAGGYILSEITTTYDHTHSEPGGIDTTPRCTRDGEKFCQH
jgi:hypothetical protein